MELARDEITLLQWGNSKALRLPVALANVLNFNIDDRLQLNVEVNENTGEKRLVVGKYAQPQTIEELFKDYKGEPFQAKIQEFMPTGNELW
ncbi:MAG: AbrB/MazE/SpoVT family DNA-binding domain-containing protein [Oscillospiraceae bacterium]|nr:AbrB/MazE/SpoVT family DNA-binding domain-containing protein [Oscillospiraceae bacterium]